MIGLIGSLAGLIKIHNSKTLVDDAVFRLHYRWTTSLCFLACALVAASDMFGEPIQCLMNGGEAPKPYTTFCWVSSTFTINTSNADGESGHYESYGSNYSGTGKYDSKTHEKRIHTYYQWVPFVLFALGALFYLPHLIWKEIEGKKVECLLQGLSVISMDDAAPAKKMNIVKYLFASHGRLNNRYAYGYFFSHVLNLVVVVSAMFILESFFGGVFLDYGSKTVRYLNGHADVAHNPLIFAFPRVAKCHFRMYGPSGSLENHDLMCLLPQNIINEKIFLFIWFWLLILTTATAMQIVYIAAIFLSPFLRLKLLETYGRVMSDAQLEDLVHRTYLGDWFLLRTLGKNVDALTFKDIMQELVKMIAAHSSSGSRGEPVTMFSPHAPSYRHFNIDEEDPLEHKRRMEEEDTRV
ncbi:Innexin [Hyalella azteca]|uniref:Innexin n=1 Tax=Hyalella azteca TaxID=294128 RepID=A0A6A0H8A9_HYAAZ|nr:innexin inx2 [Hyalella azteca]KAA0201481.1 Innexin [Hyalella azteca]